MKKNSIQSLYLHLVKVSPRRKFLISFLLGLFSTLSLPPIHFFLILFLTVTGLIWLLDEIEDFRISFCIGWFFGVGYFLGGLYWISYAFLVNSDKFALFLPFAMIGLSSLLSIFIGLTTFLFSKFRFSGLNKALVFSSLWVMMEWLRGHIFTGLPWNLIGSALTFSDELIQISSIFGTWGLSFFAILSFSFLGCTQPKFLMKKNLLCFLRVGFPFIILITLWCGGYIRLLFAEENFFPNVKVNVIQANIQQKDKWLPKNREKNFFKHLDITRDSLEKKKTEETIELFIWPETAIQFFLDENKKISEIVGKNLSKNGLLFSGGIRKEKDPYDKGDIFWNSILFLDDEGRELGIYDKFHLVPFGEYVPLKTIIPIEKITQGFSDFSPGDGLKTLHLNNVPSFSPLICFEVIFPGQVANLLDRPKWLLNVTNDAWFGLSSGPYQHFSSARLRSVEEGLPLVRAANTGISAIIDPYGRVINKLDLLSEGYIDNYLPKPLASRTLYAKFGDRVFFIFLLILFSFIGIRKKLLGNKFEKY